MQKDRDNYDGGHSHAAIRGNASDSGLETSYTSELALKPDR